MKLLRTLLRKKRKNESLSKYVFALLHLWLGLLSSGVIFLVCITGSIYTFKNQIIEFINRDKVFIDIPKGATRMSLNDIQTQFEQQDWAVESILIPKSDSKSLFIIYKNRKSNLSRSAYFDPYTGKDLGVASNTSERFFQIVLNIHKTLLISGIGKQVVGVSVIIFIIMLFSGLVLWWPKNTRVLKNALTIKLKAKWRRINYDLHNVLGFYSLILLIFIAVTGLYITYPWMKSALLVSLGGKTVGSSVVKSLPNADDSFARMMKEMMAQEEEKEALKDVQTLSLQAISDMVHGKLHYKGTTLITMPTDTDPRIHVKKVNDQNWLGALLPDVVTFDKTGALKSTELFRDKPLSDQFVTISLPLHTGEIMGWPSLIVYFIASLIGSSLPITGFIIWWKRVYRK